MDINSIWFQFEAGVPQCVAISILHLQCKDWKSAGHMFRNLGCYVGRIMSLLSQIIVVRVSDVAPIIDRAFNPHITKNFLLRHGAFKVNERKAQRHRGRSP